MVLGSKIKILFGLFLLGSSGGLVIDHLLNSNSTSTSFASPQDTSAKWEFAVPSQLFIPKIRLSARIISAEKQENTWEVHPHDINYGIGTAIPGEPGNTVIFAHRRRNLFIDLNKINIGDQIFVGTSIDFFSYQVIDKFSVNPSEPWPTASTKNDELTLFTCNGTEDKERLIIKARPI